MEASAALQLAGTCLPLLGVGDEHQGWLVAEQRDAPDFARWGVIDRVETGH